MNWPIRIEDAFNIVRPLTQEERQQMQDIAIDLAKPKDNGRLGLDTKERREQEKYFGEGEEPEEEENDE